MLLILLSGFVRLCSSWTVSALWDRESSASGFVLLRWVLSILSTSISVVSRVVLTSSLFLRRNRGCIGRSDSDGSRVVIIGLDVSVGGVIWRLFGDDRHAGEANHRSNLSAATVQQVSSKTLALVIHISPARLFNQRTFHVASYHLQCR